MGATDGADVPGRPSPRPRELFAHPKLRASPEAQRGAHWGVIGRSEAQSHAREAYRAAFGEVEPGRPRPGDGWEASPSTGHQAPEGSVQSRRAGLTPWPLEPPHLPKVHNQFADFP